MELISIMIKTEIYKIVNRKQFLVIFLILFGAAILDFLVTCKSYFGCDLSFVRSAYRCYILNNEIGLFTKQFYSTLFPIMICTGVSDVFFMENKLGITNFIYTRTAAKNNLLSKMIAVLVVSFFLTWIPLMVNYLLVLSVFPLQGYYCSNASFLTLTVPEKGRMLGEYEMFYPYWNCMIYILIRCFIGSAIALFAFSLSLLQRFNKYIILLSGMILYIIYDSVIKLPPFENTAVNTDIFAINGYGNGWMIVVFIAVTTIISLGMVAYGTKKEICG